MTEITDAQAKAIAKQDEAAQHPRDEWITHNELIEALSILYPGAVHGRHFFVAHMVAPHTGEQLSTAFIAQWNVDGKDEPTLAELMKAVAPHKDKARSNVRAREVRSERNARLDASDRLLTRTMEVDDAAKLATIKAYRQALRDVPEQSGFPFDVEWPETPDMPR